jgi:hypothetical protein
MERGSVALADIALGLTGMLPTPRVKGHGNSHQRIEEGRIDDLTTMAKFGMLPTPAPRDYKGTNDINKMKEKILQGERAHQGQLANFIGVQTSSNSQLNPRFVIEMLGFPPNHKI